MSAENDNKPLEEVKPEVKAEETQEVCWLAYLICGAYSSGHGLTGAFFPYNRLPLLPPTMLSP